MEEQPAKTQRKPTRLPSRARANSTSNAELATETISLGRRRGTLFNISRKSHDKDTFITEGLIDVDATLKFGDTFNRGLLNILFQEDVLNLYLFTKMKKFKIFHEGQRTDEIGGLLERLNAIHFVESYLPVKEKAFHVPCVITAQDLTLHIPFSELKAFIKAEEAYVYVKAKEAESLPESEKEIALSALAALKKDPKLVRRCMLDEARDKALADPNHSNPYEHIEQLRQALSQQKFLPEQFGVGMAFAFALCELYGYYIAKKVPLLKDKKGKDELKTLKNHLENVIKRNGQLNIRGTLFLQYLLGGKYDAEFKSGKTFMQIIHMDQGDKDYSYDEHMDYAQKVSDSLVDFCTLHPLVSKILMFGQYVRSKPSNVNCVVVAEDRDFELTEIKSHPWANSSPSGPVPVVCLFVESKQTSEDDLRKQFEDQKVVTASRSANVSPANSPAVTPPKSPHNSSGSDDDLKGKNRDKLSQSANIPSTLKKFGIGLKAKTTSSTDDLTAKEVDAETKAGLKMKRNTSGANSNF